MRGVTIHVAIGPAVLDRDVLPLNPAEFAQPLPERFHRSRLSGGWTATTPVVNARDRIGKGPWFNAKGQLIASGVEQLHGANNLTKATALTEKARWSTAAATRPTRTPS